VEVTCRHVGYYAEQDAELTLKLWQRFKQEIRIQSLETVWELEQQLIPVLIKMRQRGVRVQVESAEKLKTEMMSQRKRNTTGHKKRNRNRHRYLGTPPDCQSF